ncbi:MAG TPA: hypothetical protein VHM70_01835, partial [Polyangiaceae bacterium]|nr:hypothetical protein [Polyangiaceae bacterium]
MASIDLDRLRTQARIAYEWARIRDALLGIVPAVALVALTLCVAERPSSSLAFGSLMIVMSGAMLWYGRAPQRAVLPGIAAGLLPLVMALCANQVHSCGPDGCTSWCVPAC